jgi:hypothetical protein
MPPRRPIYNPSPSSLPKPPPFYNTTFSGAIPNIYMDEDKDSAPQILMDLPV